MKYSIDILQKANAVIEKRRRNALEQFEKNKQIAYSRAPQLIEIDNELSLSGSFISREVLNKKGDFKETLQKLRMRNDALIDEKKRILENLGLGSDFLSIPYYCNNCNDTGYVNAMPCSCLNTVISEFSKSQTAKLGNTESASFETFDIHYYPENLNGVPCREIIRKIFENCRQYAEDFSLSSPNLLLFGGTGIGKTHISLAIAKKVLENGFDVIYMSAPDLFTSLEKERFNQEAPAESMQNIVECDLLVIDDLGAEFTTSFTISALYNIINTRLLSDLPTIITANLSPSELQQRYSERIASRLLGCYEHLRFIGNDIRILKKKGY